MSNNSQSKFTIIFLSFLLTFSGILYFTPLVVKAQEIELQDQSSSNQVGQTVFLQPTSTGLITGNLSYPSEHIPALTIIATRLDNGKNTYYSLETADGQSSYALRVDPGVYQVVAYYGGFAGGYTQSVFCGLGLNCSDHSLLPVLVQAGDILSNINPGDWYAPAGSFPTRPDGSFSSSTSLTCQARHTVQPGENLFRIGLKYNLTWIPIAEANNLSNPNLIYAGQVLCIPTPTNHPDSGSETRSQVPTIEILSVVRNKRVTIQTENFPAHTIFSVTMGKYGTKGVGGIEVAKTESGSGGSFTATYQIPHALRGQDQIAIRLQSVIGYYSYNWFYNNSTN
ncbi:MAG: LysM peptidoglycan-binding domain-containing protein [Anaerolineales bacterium]